MKSALVLLLPGDTLEGLRTLTGLQSYGYDVLVADSTSQALSWLVANARIRGLVVHADLPEWRGLTLAKAARKINPNLAVVYTSHMPHRLPEREKVAGAPCLRLPYYPHQLAGILGQLTGRGTSDDTTQVA